MDRDYDIIVIGGGPAGSTSGTLLARRGHRVLLLERLAFPRFHIGESITAFGADAFKELGIYEELKRINHVQKKGIEFVRRDGNLKIYFPEEQRNEPGELPWAFQMPRADLDKVMLDNARREGVDVRERHAVTEVLFEGEKAVGVEFRDLSGESGGEPKRVTARWVIDASGQAGVVNRQIRNNCYDDFRLGKKIAIYSHWCGDIGITNTDEDVNFKLCIHDNRRDWAWSLPVGENRVSLGVVLSRETVTERGSDQSLESLFYRYAREIPYVAEFLENPTLERVEKFRGIADYSYHSRRYYGDGWCLVGDSAGFIDPVFSTGLQIAFNSAFDLVEILDRCLQQERPDLAVFKRYDQQLDRYYRLNSTLVDIFYASGMDFSKSANGIWVWRNVAWASWKHRLLYLWYLLRLISHPMKQRQTWAEEVLFGRPEPGNLYAELFLVVADSQEQVYRREQGAKLLKDSFYGASEVLAKG